MANVLIEGDLGLHKRKSVEVRYFVLKEDRLEYFLTKDDFVSGMDPRGQLKKSEMQSVQLEGSLILQLRLIQGHALRLSIPEGSEAAIESWMQKFGEIGISSFIPIDDDSDDANEEKAKAFAASAASRKSLADAGEAGAQHIKETLARLKGEASLPEEAKKDEPPAPEKAAEPDDEGDKAEAKAEAEAPSPDAATTPTPTPTPEPATPASDPASDPGQVQAHPTATAEAEEPSPAATEKASPPAVAPAADEETKPAEPAPKATPRKSRADPAPATKPGETRKSLAPSSASAAAKARAGSTDASRKSRASFGGTGASPMFPQVAPKRASLSPSPSAAASVRKSLNAGVTDPLAKRKSRASVKGMPKAAASPAATSEESTTPKPADPEPTDEAAAAAAVAQEAAAEAEAAEQKAKEAKEVKEEEQQKEEKEQGQAAADQKAKEKEEESGAPVPQPQEEPQPANPRVIDVDDDEAPPKAKIVTIEGLLDIVKRKKNETRYFVMLAKHVEYYDSKEDFDANVTPKGKLLFRDLSAVASDGASIKVTVSGKDIELQAQDEITASDWASKWTQGWERVGGRPEKGEEASLGGDLENSPAASGSEGEEPAGMVRTNSALADPNKRKSRGSVSFAAVESETFHVDAVAAHDHTDDETSTAGSTPPATSDKEVSEEEKERIKKLTNWVRGGKPPLKKGVFEWQKDDTGLKTTKYLELYDDGILYYDAPADSQGHSSPFSPEGKIKLVDVKDIEPTEDGFDVVMKAGCKIKLRGPQNAAGGKLDDWLEQVGEAIENAKEAAKKEEEAEAARQAEEDEDDGEPPLMLGPVTCNKGPGHDNAQGEALLKPLELVLPAGEGKKPLRIPLRDIKDVQMTPEGFMVETLDGRKILVEVPPEERESWSDAWDAALQDGFERADDGHWRRRKVLPLARANIIVVRNGEEALRHVVCYTDRFAIYKDEDSARRKEPALHEIWPSQVRMVRVHDEGIALRTEEDEYDLKIPNEGGELDRFYDAMRTCFSRRPVDIEGLEEEYAEDANPENPESPSQANSADEDAEHLRQLADLPPSADPRAVQLTMPRRGDKRNKAICQGMLGFYDHGRLHMLYSILYPDRLDAFECVEAVLWSNPPKMSLRVADMMSLEALSAGFLLEVHDPLHKKLGVNVATQQELKIWVARLNEVMQKCKEGGEAAISTPRKGQKTNNLADRSGFKVPMPQKAKPGFVPRCAFVIYKSPREASPDWSESRPRVLKQSRSIHLSKHTPPESHNGKKKRGVVINTHRAGWQAHGLVERGRVVNPSDLLNPPTPRPQAPERADKISNHVTCPRTSPEQKMAYSPVGNRTISKPAEPGSCPWQKITSSSY